MNTRRIALVVGLSLVRAGLGPATSGQETKIESVGLEGETFAHDPSTIVKDLGRYYVFHTGRGISTKTSLDLLRWSNGPPVLATLPSWTTNTVPGYRGHTWAPDLIRWNGQYHLYYSVSTFGKQVSAIALATSPTLDPSAAGWGWTDRGAVITSTNGSPFNAIDPSVLLDEQGALWMVFGSFWRGIYLLQLDPKTGRQLQPEVAPRQVAWSEAVEAPCLAHHGAFYYLFVNWGRCCRGTNSTYEVRVGRSTKIAGPYLDRDGVDLVDRGGTLFLQSIGRFIGPGHIGLFEEGDLVWFSYHYYDAESNGRSRLGLGQLEWSADGWPKARRLRPGVASDSH